MIIKKKFLFRKINTEVFRFCLEHFNRKTYLLNSKHFMKRKSIIVSFTALVLIAFISCQKDADQPASANDITGTWKFVSVGANINATQLMSDGSDVIKTVVANEYVTENNSGTVTFDGTKMIAKNVSYSINAISKASVYENGTLADTFSLPLQFTAAAVNGSAAYRKIAADSIYVESGLSLYNDGMTQSSQPGGAKLKLENDKLYLIQSQMQTATESESGATVTSTLHGTFILTLQRQ